MTDKLNEYKNLNKSAIEALSDDERYQWYLRIKQSLPQLKKLGGNNIVNLEQAIIDYEQRHGIK